MVICLTDNIPCRIRLQLTVQHGTQLVQIAVHTRELDRDLVNSVHKVLDDQDVVRVVDDRNGRGRWR